MANIMMGLAFFGGIALVASMVYWLSTIKEKELVGLSLSFCVSQMARGEVKESDVSYLRTSTNCPDVEVFQQVLEEYATLYWKEFPEQAKAIAMRFWEDKKIKQPRVNGERYHYVGSGIWMDQYENTFHILPNGKR